MSDRRDPYRGFNFKLEIDGVVCAGFREASGLDEELPTIGGIPKYNNITLKWGVTDDHSLLEWGDRSTDGKTQRKNGSIILMDEDRPVQVWNSKGAVPVKYTGPTLNASAKDVEIETLEIEHEGITKA